MKQIRQGNALDMYYRTFPGDPYVLAFEPSDEQVTAMTAHAARYAAEDAEQEQLMQMLGLIPSDTSGKQTRTTSEFCRNGHKRSVHSVLTHRDGYMRCTKCAADKRQKHAA